MSDEMMAARSLQDVESLLGAARSAFDLTDIEIGREYGQKLVFPARRGDLAVVVKLIQLGSTDDIVLERARREVDVLQRVAHPNVVKVVAGLVELGGSGPQAVAWLEERLRGEDLWERFDRPWTPDEAIALGLDVSRGLGALHAQNVIHRDLSPGNVFACADGSFVVLDPGYGKHLDRSSLTGSLVFGTSGHLSPEQLESRTGVSRAADVFAVGILLHLALTGRRPFEPDDDQYQSRLYHQQADSVAVHRPGLEPGLVAVVDHCLHRHPGRRYVDGDELAAALEAL